MPQNILRKKFYVFLILPIFFYCSWFSSNVKKSSGSGNEITWKIVPNHAQYGGASYDNVVKRIKRTDLNNCLSVCTQMKKCDFFFYNARGNLAIGHHHKPPDPSINSDAFECVLFHGKPWWGTAPQSDGYIKYIGGVTSHKLYSHQ
jgi:hypothetical protein